MFHLLVIRLVHPLFTFQPVVFSSDSFQVGMLEAVAGMVREQLEEQDEVGLINFYAENNTQFHELSSTIASLSQELPTVSTRKCYLDVDAANAQIFALQGLHLLIAGLTNDPPIPPPQPSAKQTKSQPKHPPSSSRPPTQNGVHGTSPTHKNPQPVSRASSQTSRSRASPSPTLNRPSANRR
jgi:hypothetical protein